MAGFQSSGRHGASPSDDLARSHISRRVGALHALAGIFLLVVAPEGVLAGESLAQAVETTWATAGVPLIPSLPVGILLVVLALSSALLAPLASRSDRTGSPALVAAVHTRPLSASAHPLPANPPPVPAPEDFGRVMSQMSHDLRTPLNAIIGFSDIMQRELLGPLGSERYHGYAGFIRDSGFSLLRSVEDTMTLTRLLAERDRLPLERILLADVASDALARVAGLARERGILIEISDVPDVAVAAELQALRQATANLFEACVGLAGTGARIAIGGSAGPHTVTLEVAVVTPGAVGTSSGVAGRQPDVVCAMASMLIELQGGRFERTQNGRGLRFIAELPKWQGSA